MSAVALTIAGSDPSGGAGLQADLKTFTHFGVYGEAVPTLITVQNTRSVSRVEVLSPQLVREQVEAVISDIPPTAAKTGALGSTEMVALIAELARTFSFPLIVDPVAVSKHGGRLLSPAAEGMLRSRLLPHAALVTPNIPEAEALTGLHIESLEEMAEAAARLLEFGCRAVLVKGGHRSGTPVDVLHDGTHIQHFEGERIDTPHTHGTGCTYSAAITANLALGHSLWESIHRAKAYIHAAIATAPKLGGGRGPVNHFSKPAFMR